MLPCSTAMVEGVYVFGRVKTLTVVVVVSWEDHIMGTGQKHSSEKLHSFHYGGNKCIVF